MPAGGDVVIVGAGVVGLSIAHALASEGLRPVVLDRRAPGREASWAGAGMIAPEAESPGVNPLVRLRTWSAQLYPVWAERLRQETGIDVGYRRSGGVDVALDEPECNALVQAAGAWRAWGVVHERLSPADFARVEPALGPDVRDAYFLPDRAQVRNPWLLRALAESVRRKGGSILAEMRVDRIVRAGTRALAVETRQGILACGELVIAAGAWTGPLLEGAGITLRTPPRRGQIVLLHDPARPLRRIIERGHNYLVPRDEGAILVGATDEDAGFDPRPSEAGYRALLEHAYRLCPVLKRAEILASWTGPRPGSIDARPSIGRAPGFENLIVASGHHRAGLQLAPATAELVAEIVLNRATSIPLEAFRLDRAPMVDEASNAFRS